MANPVSMDEYKLFASISGVKTDDRIARLLEFSKNLVEQYIGMKFAGPSDDFVVYTIKDRHVYFLDTLGGTVLRGTMTSRSTGITRDIILETDFIVEGTRLELLDMKVGDRDKISLVIAANSMSKNAVDSSPDEIKLAIMLLTQYYFKEEYNKTAATNGGQQIDYAESNSLPHRVRAILDFHRVL